MKIQIDGTSTVNKGSELMLYAVLEQIEMQHPNSEVLFNTSSLSKPVNYIRTNLNFHKHFAIKYFGKIASTLKVAEILKRFSLPYTWLTQKYVCKGVDVILDAGGFQFSDQMKHDKRNIYEWSKYYSNLKRNNVKIILLPQAFGPFKTDEGKEVAKVLDKYADIIIARDAISQQFLSEADVSLNKIRTFPDFTSTVNGVVPERLNHLRGKVCVIPNSQMIKKVSNIDNNLYISFLVRIIKYIIDKGHEVFLLNHESDNDLFLCKLINQSSGYNLPIVTGLTAKEIKGIISISYLVISSRFHGVANALNSSVPCLATSWSHKYEMLFSDYGEKDRLISQQESFENISKKLDTVLPEKENKTIRNNLTYNMLKVQLLNKKMWEEIWEFIERK